MSEKLPEKFTLEISEDLAEALLLPCGGGRHDYFTLLGLSPRQATVEDATMALKTCRRELRKILFDRDFGVEPKQFQAALKEIENALATNKSIADYRREIETAPRRAQMTLLRQFEAESSEAMSNADDNAKRQVLDELRERASEIGLNINAADSLLRRYEEDIPLALDSAVGDQNIELNEDELVLDFGDEEVEISSLDAPQTPAMPHEGDFGSSDDSPWNPMIDTAGDASDPVGDGDIVVAFQPSDPPSLSESAPLLKPDLEMSSEDVKETEPDIPGAESASDSPPKDSNKAKSSAPRTAAVAPAGTYTTDQKDFAIFDEEESHSDIFGGELPKIARAALRRAATIEPLEPKQDEMSHNLGAVVWRGYFPIHGKNVAETRHLIRSEAGDALGLSTGESERPDEMEPAFSFSSSGGDVASAPNEIAEDKTALMDLRGEGDDLSTEDAPIRIGLEPEPDEDGAPAPLVPGFGDSSPEEDQASPSVFIAPHILRQGMAPDDSADDPFEKAADPYAAARAPKSGGANRMASEYSLLLFVIVLFVGVGGGIYYLSQSGGQSSGTGSSSSTQVGSTSGSGALGGSGAGGGGSGSSAGMGSGTGSGSISSAPPSGYSSSTSGSGGFDTTLDSGILYAATGELAQDRMVAFSAGFLGPHFLPEFEIRAYEVSIGEYAEFIEQADHPAPLSWESGEPPIGQETMPVTDVTYFDAQQYVIWRTQVDHLEGWRYELPTVRHYEGLMLPRLYLGQAAHIGKAAPKMAAITTDDVVGDGRDAVYQLFGNIAEWALAPDQGRGVVMGSSYKETVFDPFQLQRSPTQVGSLDSSVGFRYIKTGVK